MTYVISGQKRDGIMFKCPFQNHFMQELQIGLIFSYVHKSDDGGKLRLTTFHENVSCTFPQIHKVSFIMFKYVLIPFLGILNKNLQYLLVLKSGSSSSKQDDPLIYLCD